MTEQNQPEQNRQELPRILGLWDGLALTIGAMIGSGIFRTPGNVAQPFISLGPALTLWISVGFLVLLGSLTFAELTAMFPRTGGLYVYLHKAYGKSTAFTFGWAQLILLRPASIGGLALVVAEFTNRALGLTLDIRIVSISTIVLLTLTNILGVQWGSLVMKICTAIKMLALIVIIGLVFAIAKGSFIHIEPFFDFHTTGDKTFFAALAAGIVGVLWSYDGWVDTTYVAGEIKEPQKNVPRALIIGLAIVTVIYVLANLAYMYTLQPAALKASKSVAHDTIGLCIGNQFALLITIAIIISVLGTTNGTILTGARVVYAMSNDKLTFGFLGTKHSKFSSPITALIIQGTIASLLIAWNPSFEDLIGDFTFTMWIFYIAGACTIFIFRKTDPDAPRPYKVFLYPIVPLAFFMISTCMIINAVAVNPEQTGLRIVAIAAGYPIFFIWHALKK